jgi:integrase
LDGEQPEWRIPAERMKMREAHIVPLARQSVDFLRALQPITGRQGYVFPANGGGGRPLSENTLNGAIRRLGYSGEEMTAHGFRTMASTPKDGGQKSSTDWPLIFAEHFRK